MVSKVVARSPAKLILLGEHFVVHGSRAISAALNIFVEGELVDDDGAFIEVKYIDHVEKYSLSRDNVITRFVNFLRQTYNVDSRPSLYIRFSFPTSAGLGSSASLASVLTKLFHKMYREEDPPKDIIYSLGSKFEEYIHGNPSGIDLSTVVEGGVILFKRDVGVIDKIDSFDLAGSRIIVVDSGIRRSTGKLVSNVTYNLHSLPDDVRRDVIEVVDSIVSYGWISLKEGDRDAFAEAMKSNHYLLKYIGVYRPKLDKIVDALIDIGAYSAKVTGAGGGGCIYGLVDEAVIDDVESFFRDMGLWVYTPKIYF